MRVLALVLAVLVGTGLSACHVVGHAPPGQIKKAIDPPPGQAKKDKD